MFKQYNLKSSTTKTVVSLLTALVFIYILLFEFIIPANKVLPKPSILYLSVTDLFNDYNFLSAFILTISVIYISIFVSYFVLKLFASLLIEISFFYTRIDRIFLLVKYILPIFLIFLFSFWFENNIYAEYLFAFIIIGTALKETLVTSTLNIETEYIEAAKSLSLNNNELIKKVIWKTIQPKLYKTINKYHFVLWMLIIIYEFITGTNGLGNIFRLALKYNDISIIVLLSVIIMITMYLFSLLLDSVKRKFFFWEV